MEQELMAALAKIDALYHDDAPGGVTEGCSKGELWGELIESVIIQARLHPRGTFTEVLRGALIGMDIEPAQFDL